MVNYNKLRTKTPEKERVFTTFMRPSQASLSDKVDGLEVYLQDHSGDIYQKDLDYATALYYKVVREEPENEELLAKIKSLKERIENIVQRNKGPQGPLNKVSEVIQSTI